MHRLIYNFRMEIGSNRNFSAFIKESAMIEPNEEEFSIARSLTAG